VLQSFKKKAVSGNVVVESIAFSSGINMLAGGSSVPLISERKGTDARWKHVNCLFLLGR